MEQNTMPGGWSAWSFTPTKETTNVFNESLGKLLGVKYKLVASASQLVNGTNYVFLCEAEASTLSGLDYIVVANVYQPLKGQPHISNIKSVGPKPGPAIGGWQNWHFSVTPRANTIFAEATKNLLGVKYKPLAFTQQLVAGMNYCFLCEATPATLIAPPSPALVWINQPLQGAPHVYGIHTIYQNAGQLAEAEMA